MYPNIASTDHLQQPRWEQTHMSTGQDEWYIEDVVHGILIILAPKKMKPCHLHYNVGSGVSTRKKPIEKDKYHAGICLYAESYKNDRHELIYIRTDFRNLENRLQLPV